MTQQSLMTRLILTVFWFDSAPLKQYTKQIYDQLLWNIDKTNQTNFKLTLISNKIFDILEDNVQELISSQALFKSQAESHAWRETLW